MVNGLLVEFNHFMGFASIQYILCPSLLFSQDGYDKKAIVTPMATSSKIRSRFFMILLFKNFKISGFQQVLEVP
jgi:hypothetical protein